MLNIDSGKPPRRLLTKTPSQRIRGLAWLPGQMRVIVGLSERTSDIVLFDQGP